MTGAPPADPTLVRDGPVLLFDGACAFCAESVRFVLRHERPGARPPVRFAAREGAAGRACLARHPHAAAADSMVWVEAGPSGERAGIRSDAAISVLRHLGGGWAVVGVLVRSIPRPWRDAVYDVIARHRHAVLRGREQCVVFTDGERARVLP